MLTGSSAFKFRYNTALLPSGGEYGIFEKNLDNKQDVIIGITLSIKFFTGKR
jgi:hypothetical protein